MLSMIYAFERGRSPFFEMICEIVVQQDDGMISGLNDDLDERSCFCFAVCFVYCLRFCFDAIWEQQHCIHQTDFLSIPSPSF